MNNRDYQEALERILLTPVNLIEKQIQVEYEKCNEKPLFYDKLLLAEELIFGFVDNKREEFKKVQNYCWKKMQKSIKLFRNPDNLSKVLRHTLTVSRLNSPAVLRGYYELTTNKKIFYPEILRLSKDPKLVEEYPYKTDAIRQFCEEQIKEDSFWKRNDYSNLKWIGTSTFTLLSITPTTQTCIKSMEPAMVKAFQLV